MDVGIGLPNAVPGTGGPVPADWARRAEQAGLGGGSPDMFAQAATAPDKTWQDAASAAVSQDMVRSYFEAFGQSGRDELILFPCSSDPEQVGLLAQAARG